MPITSVTGKIMADNDKRQWNVARPDTPEYREEIALKSKFQFAHGVAIFLGGMLIGATAVAMVNHTSNGERSL